LVISFSFYNYSKKKAVDSESTALLSVHAPNRRRIPGALEKNGDDDTPEESFSCDYDSIKKK